MKISITLIGSYLIYLRVGKKIFFFVLLTTSLHSQTVEIEGGLSYSKYNYKNSFGASNTNVKADLAGYFKIQLDTLFSSPLTYGIKLQQHNATGGNQDQAYNWNAFYGGLFVNTNILNINERIKIKAQAGLSTLIFGEQQIGGSKYRLKSEKEFNGLWQNFGGQATFKVKDESIWTILASYSIEQSIKLGEQGPESLNFLSQNFGLIIRLKSPKKEKKPKEEKKEEEKKNESEVENAEKTITNEVDSNITVINNESIEDSFGLVAVFFEINKSKVSRSFYAKLEELSSYVEKNPKYKIKVSGYADSATGNTSLNQALSIQRVQSVIDVLIEMGVSPDLFEVNPMGETLLFSQSLYDLNRRVDIELISNEK
jgi:outer membrane protein OmpA-like peptidoglycan-associated protein